MSSTPQNGSVAGAPIQPPNKSGAATAKLNSEDMEMGNMSGADSTEDIMQLARVGNVPAMEKLFEKGEFDATYTDDEGITPLHVGAKNYWTFLRAIRQSWGYMLTFCKS
jgi:palmitoyltransferase ZDHHC13/17